MLQPAHFLRMAAVAALLLVAPSLHADETDEPRPGQSARYPGPSMWRVSKGDHELLLFGTLSSVPKHLRWNPANVERALARAQAALSPPGVRATPSLKPVQLVRLWRRVRELSANPDGKPLSQTLPPDLYRQYAAARDRYVRRDRSLETQRPIVVAGRVYEDAVDAMGLESSRAIESQIERAVRRAGVEITDTKLHVEPETLLERAARATARAELDCFAKVLALIEADERRLAARARAWARGDLAALRSFDYPDIRRDCLSYPGWPPELAEALDEADALWLASAERALAVHRTTFGTLDMRDLVARDGLLAKLEERGYTVREP